MADNPRSEHLWQFLRTALVVVVFLVLLVELFAGARELFRINVWVCIMALLPAALVGYQAVFLYAFRDRYIMDDEPEAGPHLRNAFQVGKSADQRYFSATALTVRFGLPALFLAISTVTMAYLCLYFFHANSEWLNSGDLVDAARPAVTAVAPPQGTQWDFVDWQNEKLGLQGIRLSQSSDKVEADARAIVPSMVKFLGSRGPDGMITSGSGLDAVARDCVTEALDAVRKTALLRKAAYDEPYGPAVYGFAGAFTFILLLLGARTYRQDITTEQQSGVQ